jgi:protein XagA
MKYIFLFSALLLSVDIYGGGGWPQKKREGYFKLDQRFLIANRFFSPEGKVVSITTISLYNTNFYGEYGFTDKFTGIVYFPFFFRSTLNEVVFKPSGFTVPGDEVNSVGDPIIGIKYGLIKDKPIVVSASLNLGIPLGNTSGGKTQILQTGDGEFNQLLKLEASRSFYSVPIYVTLTAGFNNRTNNFSDEFHYGLEAGYTFKDKLTGIFRVYGVESLYNGGNVESTQNSIFSNNTEYLSYGPELIYSITPKFGVTAAAYFAWSGKNILAAPSYIVGAYLKLTK